MPLLNPPEDSDYTYLPTICENCCNWGFALACYTVEEYVSVDYVTDPFRSASQTLHTRT